jgi:hypothetical protein
MNDLQQSTENLDWKGEKKKLPETLNVVSIISLVGCGLGAIFSILGFVGAQSNYDKLVEMQGNLDNAPDFVKKLAGPAAVEMARKSLENRLPILLLSLVACAICLYGVLQMRALKKVGFSIYLIGELLPVPVTFIFLGMAAISGITLAALFIIPIVFISLYASQVKHLK